MLFLMVSAAHPGRCLNGSSRYPSSSFSWVMLHFSAFYMERTARLLVDSVPGVLGVLLVACGDLVLQPLIRL